MLCSSWKFLVKCIIQALVSPLLKLVCVTKLSMVLGWKSIVSNCDTFRPFVFCSIHLSFFLPVLHYLNYHDLIQFIKIRWFKSCTFIFFFSIRLTLDSSIYIKRLDSVINFYQNNCDCDCIKYIDEFEEYFFKILGHLKPWHNIPIYLALLPSPSAFLLSFLHSPPSSPSFFFLTSAPSFPPLLFWSLYYGAGV